LANASGPAQSSVLPSFVQTLSELTPEEVGFLDRICESVTFSGKLEPAIGKQGIKIGSYSALGLKFVGRDAEKFASLRENYHFLVVVDDLVRLGILRHEQPQRVLRSAVRKVFSKQTS